MAFCYAIVSRRDLNSLGITSLKRKREERWFVDFKITLMLHCGNEFRMEVCSFCFKFDDIVPRKGKIISISFFGAFEYTCFGTYNLFKNY